MKKRLHKSFARYRIKGEWFRPEKPILNLIQQYKKQTVTPKPFKWPKENIEPKHIVQAFGGQTAMARALGVPISTVEAWRVRGKIPAWRHDALKKAARKKKVDLRPDIFGPKI